MAFRSSSPSARFYAHRSAPVTPQMEQQQVTDGTQATSVHETNPFSQFRGFSAPSTRQRDVHAQSDIYRYDAREGNISPRMTMPNLVSWEAAQPRLQILVQDNDGCGARSRMHQAYSAVDVGSHFNTNPNHIKVAKHQWLPSHHLSTTYSPGVCMNSTEPSHRLQGHGHSCETPLPMSCTASRQHNTFRVPSDSLLSYLTGDSSFSASGASLPTDLEAVTEMAASIPSSALGEGASTIYPEDSVSATSRADAPPNGLPLGSLVDYVVVIHDICLAATRRYLDSLRTNWDLRNGRLASGREDENALSGHPARKRDRGIEDRWRPCTRSGPRRRAHSDNHLEHVTTGTNANQYQDDDGGHQLPVIVQNNPLPESTNSLLDNIRHICNLIWRRAQRDREDVLGAEAKACQEMSFLFECGEVIVLYNLADAARDPQACWRQLMAAGTGICQGLGDLEGLKMIEMEQMGEDGQTMDD